MYLKISVILFLVLTTTQSLSRVTVGSSPGFGVCDYLTIQDALDSGESEIKVLNNQEFIENIVIDHAVDIRGGYLSCFNANGIVDPVGSTTIKGTAIAGESVIRIITTGEAVVRLYNLFIRDAAASISNPDKAHGIEIDDATGTIEIIDSVILFNNAISGGGLYLNNSDSFFRLTVNLRNSVILGNTAITGGGAYCSGNKADLNIIEESAIKGNNATNGGGVAALNGCRVLVSSGVDVNKSSLHRGIMINSASENGGGIYARYNARITLDGSLYDGINNVSSTNPATLAINNAGLDGAGIYAIDDSTVNIHDSLIDSNTADQDGAGIFVDSSTVLNVKPSGNNCWNKGGCIVISNNKSLRLGGGLYISSGGTAVQSHFIFNSKIYGNRADFGTAVYLRGTDSHLSLVGNYIYNNGLDGFGDYSDNFVLRAVDNSLLILMHNTVVDNYSNDARSTIGNNASTVSMANSIIFNDEAVYEDVAIISSLNICIIVNEDQTIAGSNVGVIDPGFIDAVNHDFHLRSDSLSIDRCTNPALDEIDSDLENRGFDDPSVTNVNGSYDVGADETYINDIIYRNNFE